MAESKIDDAALLHRFQYDRDERAFGELVSRHGPLVWGVCRRRLERLEDAEDAFQTTFLILAIKAGTIRRPAALGGWLHCTASRVARRLATQSPRPSVDEQEAAGLDTLAVVTRREMIAAVDEELEALPRRYREVLVMFHLEGCPRGEVARRLGVSEPTVKSRLARGRALLRHRLARRGVSLPLLLPLTVEALPAGTVSSATRLGSSFGRTRLNAGDLLTTTLSQGANPMLSLITGKTGLAVVAVCVGLAVTWIVRGPAQAAGEGGVERAVMLDTSLDERQGVTESEPLVAVAMLKPTDNKNQGNKNSEMELTKVSPRHDPQPGQYFALEVTVPTVKILASLDEPTRAEFPGIPLSQALQTLATRHAINIIIKEAEIEEAGLSADATVDMFLNGVTLRTALDLILERHGLTYVVNNEVLVVTTPEDAANVVVTRGYPLTPSLQEYAPDELSERLMRLVNASSSGGDVPLIEPFQDRILVVASLEGHKHLRQFLRLIALETEATQNDR